MVQFVSISDCLDVVAARKQAARLDMVSAKTGPWVFGFIFPKSDVR